MQSILEKFVRQIDNFSIRKKMPAAIPNKAAPGVRNALISPLTDVTIQVKDC